MSESERFIAILRAIKKQQEGIGGAKVLQELREGFVSCLPSVPKDLKYDVAVYFCGEYASGETAEEIGVVGDKLLELVYLLEEDFERTEETLSQDDWEYVRDIVSEFALELDQSTLTYVMQQVVVRGAMGA